MLLRIRCEQRVDLLKLSKEDRDHGITFEVSQGTLLQEHVGLVYENNRAPDCRHLENRREDVIKGFCMSA